MEGEHLPRVEEWADRRLEWWPELRRIRQAARTVPGGWPRVRDVLFRDGWTVAFRLGGEPAAVKVRCSAVPVRFGRRLWWHCPACGTRRAALFAVRFRDRVDLRCRGCLGLRYRARQCGEHKARMFHRVEAAKRRADRAKERWKSRRCRPGSDREVRLLHAYERTTVEYHMGVNAILGASTAKLQAWTDRLDNGLSLDPAKRQARYQRRRTGDAGGASRRKRRAGGGP